MNRQTLLRSTLCLLMALVCNVAWAAIEVSTLEGTPEHVYRIMSKNNFWMTSCTSLGNEDNSGVFAFFAAGEGAYKVYSVERQKWVSYFKATEYTNGRNRAILVDTQDEANAWKVTASGDYYLFAPYLSNGNVAGFYWNWFQGIGSNPSNNVTITVGLYNSNSDGGSLWALSEVEGFDFTQIVDLNATFTDQIGQAYSCTYKGIQGKTKPVVFGGGVASISNEVWNGNSYTANISFPFMPSNAEVTNHVVISPYSDFIYKYFASGTDVKSNNKMNTSLPTDVKNYLWAFYPTFTDAGFKVKIKNVGTGTYIFSDLTTQAHETNSVSLKEVDEASSFMVIVDNQIINDSGKYLSVPSSGAGQKDVGNYHKDHNGTKNKFVAANNYTLTLSDESTYSGTNGVHNVQGGNYTYTDGVWSENGYSAKVDFNFTSLPFPLSTAEDTNATFISSFKTGGGGSGPGRFKWYSLDNADDVVAKRDVAATHSTFKNFSWAIYASLENGAFAYSIKNVAKDKYIYSDDSYTANNGSHGDNVVILSDTPTKFKLTTDGENRFYYVSNNVNQYLSLNSTGTADAQQLGIYAKTHYGTTNSFHTPTYDLSSKDELVSGGIYTFVSSKGSMGATEGNTKVISTARTTVSDTNTDFFKWTMYQSKNGNYYLYNLGKQQFMGVQTANNTEIDFVDKPAGKTLTFKDNGQTNGYPIMFSTDNNGVVNHSTNHGGGLINWTGGWNKMDDAGSNHKVTYIGELTADQLKTIADLVEAYDKSLPIKVEVEGSWEGNPNTHFGNVTATAGDNVSTTKLTLDHMNVSYMMYSNIGDVVAHARPYRGFEFQGFSVGAQDLGKSFELTEELKSSITAENPLIAKFTATEAVTLFYDDDPFPYRIPAIATTSTGRLIAVSDYRHCLDDIGLNRYGKGYRIDLVIRTSDDNGKTWSNIETIAEGIDNSQANDCAYGDAAIAVVGEEVIVMAVAGSTSYGSGTAEKTSRLVRVYSDNNGETWVKEDITEKVYGYEGALYPNMYTAFFGSGRLAVDPNFNNSGTARIYGSMLTQGNGNIVIYSDDKGLTWNKLGGQVASANEPKIEILPNGQILFSARRNGGRNFNVFTYTDKANNEGTWSTAVNGCNNEGENGTNGETFLIDAKNASGENVKLLLQSQPVGGGVWDRANVSIWYKEISSAADHNHTPSEIANGWTKGMQVSQQLSAYSAMSLQKDGKIAFFFEEAPCYQDQYKYGYCMVYLPLTIEQITKNKYFSLGVDFTAERAINVVLTDAQGNEYRKQVTSALGGVATKLTTDYPFITLGDNATLESDGESFTYTNTVTLPFKVSNESTTVWHNIYYPINTNEHNYPVYMSAIENNDVVKISYENAVYGNSSFNTQANSASISWAFYQEGTGLTFKLKNKLNGKYVKTTSEATGSNGGANVQYTENIAEAAAFVPSKEGHSSNYLGEYSLKVGDGFICVWTVSDGRVTYTTNKGHKGAWVKFVEAPDFETLFDEVNVVLNMFGDGLGQYSKISDENLAAVTAAKTAMEDAGSVKLNTLNEYKTYASKTEGGTLNLPKDGQFFRVAYDYGNAGRLYMQSTASSVKGLEFTEATGAASIWVFYDNALYSYTEGQCLRETGNDRGLQAVGGKTTATFSASTRVKGKYNLQCGSYVHANANNGKYYTDHCSSNNCEQHDLILEEVTSLPVVISNAQVNFNGATKCVSTLFTPVALEVPVGITAYIGVNEDNYLAMEPIEAEEGAEKAIIPANTGVILMADAAKTYDFAISSETDTAIEPGANIITGTVAKTIVTPAANTTCYVLANPKGENEQPKGVGLYKAKLNKNENGAAGSTSFLNNAFKAYIPVETSAEQPAPALVMRFGRGQGTTEIELPTANGQQPTAVYDLQGRRIEKIVEKGMYIINGKKVVIR